MAVLVFFARDSAGATAGNFMTALAKGDVPELVRLSHMPEVSNEDLKKKWEFTVDAGKYYRFTWKITAVEQLTETTGTAKMQVMRNATSGSSYEENFQLPLVKIDGEWKVDVSSMNRGLYPALPR